MSTLAYETTRDPTPLERAKAVYWSEPCARTFEEDLQHHLTRGFVFSTPDYFIMGRPVSRAASHAMIVDPSMIFNPEQCDCWHVYLMSGDVAKAIGIMPWPLPWVSFERHNRLRFVPTVRIADFFNTNHTHTP